MKKLCISVIIPTMNRQISLINTIEKLLEFNYIPNQIIIIDQSTNLEDRLSTQSKLKKYSNLTCIDYIVQEEPSLTKARNKGLMYAKNDVIICMDDDVDVMKNTIFDINEIFNDKKISMLAGIDTLQKNSNSLFGYIFGIKTISNRWIGKVNKSMFGKFPLNIENMSGRCKTEWAMGFFFVVRKSLIYRWNLKWDETLRSYAYAEDLDFTYSYYKKSKEENMECIIDSNIKVQHNCSREWRVESKKSTFMFVINREYLSYKHYKGIYPRIRTKWANIGVLIERIIRNNNYLDFIKAMYYCEKYRKDIKKGILHYELYK